MSSEFLKLYEVSKDLITYIDKEDVFDRAAAGGCSGLDFHQSDAFYDLIVNTRKAVKEVENGAGTHAPNTDSEDGHPDKEAYLRLFEAVKALAAHVDQERAFDKVSDLGPVGFETYQSEAFVAVIQNANESLKQFEEALVQDS